MWQFADVQHVRLLPKSFKVGGGTSCQKTAVCDCATLYARSPPEPVKRVLAACWLLLHCQRFKDKPSSAVRFDEVRIMDWEECANTFGSGKYGKMNRFSSTVPVIVATLFDVAVYLDMDN